MSNPTNEQGVREILDGSLDAVRQTCSECNHPRCHGIINSLEVTLNLWHRQAIEQAIQAHTNAEIARTLDRLGQRIVRHLGKEDEFSRGVIAQNSHITSAIQAERAKLKEVK